MMFRRLVLCALMWVVATGTHAESGAGYAYPIGLDPKGDNFLALRSLPSVREGYRIRKLTPSALFKVIEQTEDWYKIRLLHGEIGWVLRRYVGCCAVGPTKVQNPANVAAHTLVDMPQYYAYLSNLIHDRMLMSKIKTEENKYAKIKFIIERSGKVINVELDQKSDSEAVNVAALNLILVGEKLLELPASSSRDTITVTAPLKFAALSVPAVAFVKRAISVEQSPVQQPATPDAHEEIISAQNGNRESFQNNIAKNCNDNEIMIHSCIAVVANRLGNSKISSQKYNYIASLSTACNSNSVDRSLNVGRLAGQKVSFSGDVNDEGSTDYLKGACMAALTAAEEPDKKVIAGLQPSPSQETKSVEWSEAEKIEFANRLRATEQRIVAEKAERDRAFQESPEGKKILEEKVALRAYLNRLSTDRWIEHNNCLVSKQVFENDVPGLSAIPVYSDDDILKSFDFLIKNSVAHMQTYIFIAKNIRKYRANASATMEKMKGDGWLIDCIIQSSQQ